MRRFAPMPRVAAIHDLSCFGRASLTIVTPILSAMHVQTCPLPTAILSTHTGGFRNYSFLDLTEEMTRIIAHWRELDLQFDAIYSGFLGSPSQTRIVSDFIGAFKNSECLVVVDPVFADDGKLYSTMTSEMVVRMRDLVSRAHVITPNFTEASFLLQKPMPSSIDEPTIKEWMEELSGLGPEVVIITSVPVAHTPNVSSVFAMDKADRRKWRVDCSYIPAQYPGTGDAFTSVIVGSLLQGDSLPIALDRAVQFVVLAVRSTFGHNHPLREGILIERCLDTLRAPISVSTYQIVD